HSPLRSGVGGAHLIGIGIAEMAAHVVDDRGDLGIIENSRKARHALLAVQDHCERIASSSESGIFGECRKSPRSSCPPRVRHVASLADIAVEHGALLRPKMPR